VVWQKRQSVELRLLSHAATSATRSSNPVGGRLATTSSANGPAKRSALSGTPDVYFCGGDGDDTAIGIYDGFDGGPGDDALLSYCGGRVESVEHVTPRNCWEDLP
jgi:hypothetical protein